MNMSIYAQDLKELQFVPVEKAINYHFLTRKDESLRVRQLFEPNAAQGEMLAERSMIAVNGGGKNGVMGGVNRGARSKNGKIIGVIHEKFCVDWDEDELISDMIKVKGDDLGERKQLLLDHSDCLIVLPGGVGTFDEFWDSVCGKSLNMKGLGSKPICIVNTDGFYDGFIIQLKRAYDDGLLYNTCDKYYHVTGNPKDALDWCENEIKSIRSDTSVQFGEGGRVKLRPVDDAVATANSFSLFPFFTGTVIGAVLAVTILKFTNS